jgi:intein-encoded DNA endonuclease-like protein
MTPYQRLIEERLGIDLASYVRNRREAGASWRRLAADINAEGGVDLTSETVRRWYRHLDSGRDLSNEVAAYQAKVRALRELAKR